MVDNKDVTYKLNNFVIVGQGAMGLLWYHHLSQVSKNLNITLSLLATNQERLGTSELKSANYQFTAYQEQQANSYSLKYCQKGDIKSADIIILCLKSFHIADTVEKIARYINAHTIVILAHNGMGTIEDVVKLLPRGQVILALLTTHGCLRDAALTIRHTGLGQSDIGILSGKLSITQQGQLTKQLNQALPRANFHQDIKSKQWLKLAINCVINPITAINNIDNGKVNNKEFSVLINALLAEITEVSQAENIELILSDLQKMVNKVAKATSKNCSSMRSDVLACRATEIDYINGYIHRLGLKNNIATPENTRLWQQVLNLNN